MLKRAALAILLALGLAPNAFAQGASQGIVPSGNFTTGHTARCQNAKCTVAVDAGGAAGSQRQGQGYLTELGVTNTGTPLCINDALTNASGGYHQLCFGANALGGGLISYNAEGGASPLNLNFNINGSSFQFPGAGNGDVVGPNSSGINSIPTYSNTAGTLINDAGVATLTATSGLTLISPTLTATNATTTGYQTIAVTDQAANTFSGGVNAGLVVYENFGGAQGSRAAVWGQVDGTASTPGLEIDARSFYTGVFGLAYAHVNDGGTGITAKGNYYGGAFIAQALAGATFLNSLQGAEVDASLPAGSSAKYKNVLTLISVNSDAVRGTSEDNFLSMLRDASSTATYKKGISFGSSQGTGWPFGNDSTLIGTGGTVGNVLNGIDFSAVTFQPGGYAFHSPGFFVDPSGNIAGATLQGTSNFTQWGLDDTSATPTTGGMVRFTGQTGTYYYQINTAIGADFSTAISAFTIKATGLMTIPQLAITQASPASGAACTAGQIVADTGFIYTCSASGVWKRVAVTGGY